MGSFLNLKNCKMRKSENCIINKYGAFGRTVFLIILSGCISTATIAQNIIVEESGDDMLDASTSSSDEFGNKRSIITIEKDVSEMGSKIDGTIEEEEVIKLKITEEEKSKDVSSPPHDQFSMDPIFNEIIEPSLRLNTGKKGAGAADSNNYGTGNTSSTYLKSKQPYLYNAFGGFEDGDRDKRGALHLAGIIACATGCSPLVFNGYGCFCGFAGAGEPMDGIDMCCKMHDWCYTTTTCHGLEWDLPYFVPFKWKCNGGAPYCIPGKTKRSGRNSCSHQLCECDREFAMCLHKHLPCPSIKAACLTQKANFIKSIFSAFTPGGHKKDNSHKSKQRPKQTPRTLNSHFKPFKLFG